MYVLYMCVCIIYIYIYIYMRVCKRVCVSVLTINYGANVSGLLSYASDLHRNTIFF